MPSLSCYETIALHRVLNFHFLSISRHFLSRNPKCRFIVNFFCFRMLMPRSEQSWWSQADDRRNTTPQILHLPQDSRGIACGKAGKQTAMFRPDISYTFIDRLQFANNGLCSGKLETAICIGTNVKMEKEKLLKFRFSWSLCNYLDYFIDLFQWLSAHIWLQSMYLICINDERSKTQGWMPPCRLSEVSSCV